MSARSAGTGIGANHLWRLRIVPVFRSLSALQAASMASSGSAARPASCGTRYRSTRRLSNQKVLELVVHAGHPGECVVLAHEGVVR